MQGGLLSPQLFVLGVDALGRLFQRVTDAGILQQLHPRRTVPAFSLYADDVVMFCLPTMGVIVAVREILLLFGRMSGLQVNFTKSSATLIHRVLDDTTSVVQEFGYPIVELPITNFAISLNLQRPTSAQMQPLVERAAAGLPTSKAKLMTKARRVALVKPVISAIPIHQ
jgi:hypothetical protein